ncbi:putative AMP dependent ligase/synthetase [Cadophora sp. DSE1049]|nr:putative AMP dependent ligase/synthetase [Cadophora sp. DSE1049]
MGSITPHVENNELLPIILENRAKSDPYGVWAKFPISSSTYKEGFRSATHLELLNAVNKLAWLLEESLGRSENFETIAYLGPNDLRSIIVVLAGIKTGYKTFLPSPRNSKAAHHSLLTRLECKVLLTTTPELPSVSMIVEDHPMKKLQIPALVDLLSASETPHYPYDASYEEAKNDPIFVLHTSGSTGIPKPLTYTHMFNTCVANVTSLPMRENFVNLNTNFQTGSFFSIFPSFHIVGIGFQLIIPTFYGCVPVYPLPSAPPTTEGFLQALNHASVDWAFLPPVLIDELGKHIPSLDFVASRLKYIYFTGGAVPAATGDIVSSRLPLHQVMGSSECAMFPLIRNQTESGDVDWSYIQVHPASNPEFRHRFGDLHELVIVRKRENEKYQAIFTHFPHLQEYETRDLFSPHPTKPGFWKHRSRIDDVIVFLNGEKTNPVTFEQEVCRHPEVKAALVVGHQRFEASLLVERIKDTELSLQQQEELIESIWPVVQDANTNCPAHARVSRSRIMLADPAMPFLRAPKGTIQRQATLNLYEDRINSLYLESDSEEVELVKRVTGWKDFEDEDDFFSLGMDSLQVLHLRRGIISAFGNTSITTGIIYANPSVDLLAHAITESTTEGQVSFTDMETARINNLKATLKNYEDEIDKLAASKDHPTSSVVQAPEQETVLLTGSTGALGSFLLNTLIRNKSVSHTYCLNRSQDSETLQKLRNQERELSFDFPTSRITFLTGDPAKPNFGLDDQTFSSLKSTTTRIIHNAWPVDFNKTLQSFKPSLDGVLGFASFASTAKFSPSIFFIGSISSVGNYQNTQNHLDLTPETVLTDLNTPAPMGYGESKYLAERILDCASKKLQITTAAARVGQIAGTAENPRGWNRREWFPSLVMSSKFLGSVPETLGLGGDDTEGIDWVPIDQLVEVLTELALGSSEKIKNSAIQIFHPIHPAPTNWSTLLQTVKDTLAAAGSAEVGTVSFQDWVMMLKHSSQSMSATSLVKDTDDLLHRNPGVKLLDFYESLLIEDGLGKTLKMQTEKTLQSSQSLRDLKSLKKEWMEGWIQGWLKS